MATLPRKKTDIELIKDVFELSSDSNGYIKIKSWSDDYPLSTLSLVFDIEKNDENFKLIREYLNNKKKEI